MFKETMDMENRTVCENKTEVGKYQYVLDRYAVGDFSDYILRTEDG